MTMIIAMAVALALLPFALVVLALSVVSCSHYLKESSKAKEGYWHRSGYKRDKKVAVITLFIAVGLFAVVGWFIYISFQLPL